jgi:hypothetical protein
VPTILTIGCPIEMVAGWKMVSAHKMLQRIIRRVWAANEERLTLPLLPHDLLGWDEDDSNRPRQWIRTTNDEH